MNYNIHRKFSYDSYNLEQESFQNQKVKQWVKEIIIEWTIRLIE